MAVRPVIPVATTPGYTPTVYAPRNPNDPGLLTGQAPIPRGYAVAPSSGASLTAGGAPGGPGAAPVVQSGSVFDKIPTWGYVAGGAVIVLVAGLLILKK